ncbi:MAG: PRC-barrel domain-containing protein [Bacillota bacterium]
MLRRARELVGLPVISLEEGLKLGNVKTLIVNPAGKAVAALVVEEKGFFKEQKFIPFAKVHSVGANALTVAQSASAAKASSLPELVQLWKEKTTVTGARVVTESGSVLGWVQDYFVDTVTGTITGLEAAPSGIGGAVKGRSFIPAEVLRTIGKEVIVTTDEALARMQKIDGGLEARFLDVLDKTKEALPRLPKKEARVEDTEAAKQPAVIEEKVKDLIDKTKQKVALPKLRRKKDAKEDLQAKEETQERKPEETPKEE